MPGMTERERAIRDERATVFEGMKVVLAKMDDPNVTLTVEDRKAFDDGEVRMKDLDKDLGRVLRARKMDEESKALAESRGLPEEIAAGKTPDQMEYKRAWMRWLAYGNDARDSDVKLLKRAKYENRGLAGYDNAFDLDMRAELRTEAALSTVAGAGVDGDAGYLIPQGFWHNLQIALKAYGGLLSLTNIVKTATGNALPWPTTDPTGNVGSYIGENTQLSSNTNIEFGQGMMHAWFIKSGVILASIAIINDSAFDVDGFVTDRMGEQIGRKVAAELHTGAGSGSSALTGISTAITAFGQTYAPFAPSGSPAVGGYYQPAAAEKVNVLGNYSSTTPGFATLANGYISWQSILGMISCVDPAYRRAGSCTFVMNDIVQQNLRALTDGLGRPLWEPQVQVGPAEGPVARLEGFPITIDQNSPNVSTSANGTGGLLFGDFKRCMVVRQVDQAGTMRLTERYADFLQVGFLSYVRMDSQPNDLRAVAQYKAGPS